jgi:cell division cycle 2-like protein
VERAGPNLHDVLYDIRHRGGRPFPESDVCRIMRQLLDGARHMHACRIMHRDIKPGNILVAGGEPISVKICDVRLAASITNRPPYEQVGTRRYMALEMLLGKKDYDAMVDMWSLGCVMAELLIGAAVRRGRRQRPVPPNIPCARRAGAEDMASLQLPLLEPASWYVPRTRRRTRA